MTDKQFHLLLIEDNPNNIKLMVMLLEQQNYKVTVAVDAESGIEQAKAITPDMILLDIQLPEMDGMEACRIIRQDPKLTYIPIIALTAFAMPGDKERILSHGFDDYMAKPFNYREFLKLVEKLLNNDQ
ncbi:MAG: response regulator [Methylophaga sp.]|nr:response regulator [Methylophaga sp.]